MKIWLFEDSPNRSSFFDKVHRSNYGWVLWVIQGSSWLAKLQLNFFVPFERINEKEGVEMIFYPRLHPIINLYFHMGLFFVWSIWLIHFKRNSDNLVSAEMKDLSWRFFCQLWNNHIIWLKNESLLFAFHIYRTPSVSAPAY